ncbi:hypothetical protein E2C01_095997 [Portunus trituberculatus]|uniref:Uncharacterized protein n=1 Tax=Portunus trituberculatus TaxID=210409 RepID=A0A5B7JRH5_PORTR|nr:hypothetical protein [Portunus trituberculatus]
MRLRLSYT